MQQSGGGSFLTQNNYNKIVGFLEQHYSTRMGSNSIPDRLDTRIKRTVQHYMTEIAKVKGANGNPALLNQEVLRETTTSVDEWIKKQAPVPTPVSKQVAPAVAAASVAPTIGAAAIKKQPIAAPTAPTAPMQTPFSETTQSVNSFLTPDFRYSMNFEEDEDPIVLWKRVQKQREEEARKVQQSATGSSESGSVPSMTVQELEDVPPQAQAPPERLAPLPQDYLIPQEAIIKFVEKEYNIFITSSDRDWTRNKGENRYNFSVQFAPGNRSGYGLSPAVQEKFRNIQRIEFVKALLPTESLTSIVRSTASNAGTTNYDRIVNIFALPFVGVRIAELNNNGFSTNPREDNTFAIVQYDSTWNSDDSLSSTNASKGHVGYTGYIPKHLKCQRIYEPTPLSNLQKMSIRIERHDGELLKADPDVFQITRICLSSRTGGIGTGTTNYTGTDNEYIFVQTSSYFPYSAISEGDLINIQGYVPAASGTSAPAAATLQDFQDFINVPGGHYVVAIGYVTTGGALADGSNAVGYSNIIILRSRYNDPSTGSVARSYFGGSNTEEGYLEQRINDQASTASSAACINMSRQTHLVLRVITRDMDSTSNIRPDNV